MRRLPLTLLPIALVGLALLGWMHAEARRMPVVRRAEAALPGWPKGAVPVTVALLSDLHVGNAAMPAGRLRRIVAQVNALRPDLIVIAGDFIAGHEREDAEAASGLAVLKGLRAPLGVVAVPGNHDHWTDIGRVRAALEGAGVTVLANAAVRRGPLAIAGLDDQPTGHADVALLRRRLERVGGARVVLAHSPDIAPVLPADLTLLMAGHTHCGQIVLPLVGPPIEVSRPRYRCGVVREGARTVIVGAGVGTSVLPLRLGAPPDLWLVRLGPKSPLPLSRERDRRSEAEAG